MPRDESTGHFEAWPTLRVIEQIDIDPMHGQLLISDDGSAALFWHTQQSVAIWPMIVSAWPYWLGALAGVWLAWSAWVGWRKLRHPRQVGEPYCRRCNYQLTALTSDSCPECGLVLTSRHRVIGRHVPRRRIIASLLAGSVLMLTYVVMLAAGVPRHGHVSHWLDWHSPKLAELAAARDMAWLTPHVQEVRLLVPVNMSDGSVLTRHRRYLPTMRSDKPMVGGQGNHVIVGRGNRVDLLDGRTLSTLRSFEIASDARSAQPLLSFDSTVLWVVEIDRNRVHRFDMATGHHHGTTQPLARMNFLWSSPGHEGLIALTHHPWWCVLDAFGHWKTQPLMDADQRSLMEQVDPGMADFTLDGQYALMPTRQEDEDGIGYISIHRAADGQRVAQINMGGKVPGYTIVRTHHWLVTWGEHRASGEVGIELLSLRTGKVVASAMLGDDVTISRGWQPQNSNTLLATGRVRSGENNLHRVWRFDLADIVEQTDEAVTPRR